MKHTLFLIFLSLAVSSQGQITIMEDNSKVVKEPEKIVYDSLYNLNSYKYNPNYYNSLIGQVIFDTRDNVYYNIIDAFPADFRTSSAIILSDSNGNQKRISDGTLYYINNYYVVVGHYEKLKQLFLNKKFILINTKKHSLDDKQDWLANLETNEELENKAGLKGSVWTCVDIQVRRKDTDKSNGFWWSTTDSRSPIVFVFENSKFGKYFIYNENNIGRSEYFDPSDNKPLLCGRFQDKYEYDKAKQAALAKKKAEEKAAQERADESAKAAQDRKAALIKKYGEKNGLSVYNGNLSIGMTKAMCRDCWGEPQKINTTESVYSVREQWVYYGSKYVYFENGVITSIQY